MPGRLRSWLRTLDRSTLALLVLVGLVGLVAALALAGSVIAYQSELRARAAPPPLSYADLPARVLTWPVYPGSRLSVQVTRCVTDDGNTGLGRLPFVFTAQLHRVDAPQDSVDMPFGVSSAPVGCHTSIQTADVVPAELPPGRYFIDGTATATGALRAATVLWRTGDFDVLPPAASHGTPPPGATPEQD